MRTLIYISIALIFMACEDPVQEISWNTENISKKLTVEGTITTENGSHPITLKLSDDYFANQAAKKVSGAEVLVHTSNETIIYVENNTEPGVYIAQEPFRGQFNEHYKLEVNLKTPIENTSQYVAETEIQEGMRVDSITAELYKNPFASEEDDSLAVLLAFWGQEPAYNKNFYMTRLYRNDTLLTELLSDAEVYSDEDAGSNGEQIMAIFILDQFFPGDLIGVELHSITEEYYNFLDAISHISQPADPFGASGPQANAIGNINDGKSLGFFTGTHVSYNSTIVYSLSDE